MTTAEILAGADLQSQTGLAKDLITAETAQPTKLEQLAQSKANKLDTLQQKLHTPTSNEFEKAKLIGMDDSDTFTVDIDGKRETVRESTSDGLRYDAVETEHAPMNWWERTQDTLGISRLFDNKSDYSEQKQRQQVADMLGYKYVDEVTDQDIKDYGNMQTIQKLSDTQLKPGEERWIAPFIRDSVAPDLSGDWDEKGLDLEIGLSKAGEGDQDAHKRSLRTIYNTETGQDVTDLHAKDYAMNAFAPEAAKIEFDEDGMVVEDKSAKVMSASDEALNAAKAFAVTFYDEAIAKPARFLEETFTGENAETQEEKEARIDNLFGIEYNREFTEAMSAKRERLAEPLFDENTSTGDKVRAAASTIAHGITDPSLLTTSLGTLAAWIIPGAAASKLTKGAALLKNIDAAVKAGKLTRAEAFAMKAKHLATTREGITTALASQTGMMSSALGNLEGQYDEYVKNNGGVEPEEGKAAWYAQRLPIQLINQNLDKITDMSILKSPGLLNGLKKAIVSASDKNMVKFAQGVAGVMASTAFKEMSKEAAQEYTQQMLEAFNTRYGTEAFKDDTSFTEFITNEKNHKEGVIAALGGASGAVQFKAVAVGGDLSGKGFRGVRDKIQDMRSGMETEVAVKPPEAGTEEDPEETIAVNESMIRALKDEFNAINKESKASENAATSKAAMTINNAKTYKAASEILKAYENRPAESITEEDTKKIKEYTTLANVRKSALIKGMQEDNKAVLENPNTDFTAAAKTIKAYATNPIEEGGLALDTEEAITLAMEVLKPYFQPSAGGDMLRIDSSKLKGKINLGGGQTAQSESTEDSTTTEGLTTNPNALRGAFINMTDAETEEAVEKLEIEDSGEVINDPKAQVGNEVHGLDTGKVYTKKDSDQYEYAVFRALVIESEIKGNKDVKGNSNVQALLRNNTDETNSILGSLPKEAKALNTALAEEKPLSDAVNALNQMKDVPDETSQTDTHTIGMSRRTIKKLADTFGVNAAKIYKVLGQSVGQVELRKLKTADPKAEKAQYEMYYKPGRGIIPLYVEALKKLEVGDKKQATENIKKIRELVYDQEIKAERTKAAFTKMGKIVQAELDTLPASMSTTDKATALQEAFKKLPSAEVYGKNSKAIMSVSPLAAAGDVVTDPELRTALGLDTDPSMVAIRDSIEAVVKDGKNILATLGLGPKKVEFKSVNVKKELKNVKNQLKKFDDEIEKLQAELDKTNVEAEVEADKEDVSDEKLEAFGDTAQKLRRDIAKLKKDKAPLDKQRADLEAKDSAGTFTYKEPVYGEATDTDIEKVAESKAGQKVGSITPEEAAKMEAEGKDISGFTVEATEKVLSESEVQEKLAERQKLQEERTEKTKELVDTKKGKTALTDEIAEAELKVGKVEAGILESVKNLENKLRGLSERKKLLQKERARAKKMSDELEAARERVEQEADNKDLDEARKNYRNGKMPLKEFGAIVKAYVNLSDTLKNIVAELKKAGNSAIRRLLGTRPLAEVEADLAKVEAQIERAKADLKPKKEAAVKAVKDTNKGMTKADAKRTVELLTNRKKFYNALDGKREKTVAAITALTNRIKAVEKELFGTYRTQAMLDSAKGKGIKDKHTSKSGITQIYDYREYLDLTPTLIGQTGLKALVNLIPAGESRDLFKDIAENSKEVLSGLLASNDFAMKYGTATALVFDENGNLDETVAGVMGLVATDYFGTDGTGLLFNSPEQIANMLQRESEFELEPSEKALLKKGKFRKVVATQLGSAVASTLGIKAGEKLSPEEFDNIKQDLGQMALMYASHKGYVQDIRKDSAKITKEKWNSHMGEDHQTEQDVAMVFAPSNKNGDKVVEESIKIREQMKVVKDALNVDIRERSYKTTSNNAVKNEKTYQIRDSIGDAPERSQEVLRTLEDQRYRVDMTAVQELVNDYRGENKDALLAKAGWEDVDKMKGKALPEDIEAQEAKNREIEGVLEDIEALYQRVESGEIEGSLFFDWFLAKNGRYMMDSVNINPQVDKMFTRFLITPDESHGVSWNMNNEIDMQFVRLSVAQGFGFAIDKKGTEKINKFAKKLMDDVSLEDLKKAVYQDNEDLGIETEHIGHALQALETIKAYRAAKKADRSTFVATATAEFDAVTSGFILKLLQIPRLKGGMEEVKKWLKKGGVLVGDTFENGVNDLLDTDGHKDSYKTLADGVHKALKNMTEITFSEQEETQKRREALWEAVKDLGYKDSEGNHKPVVDALVDSKGDVTSFGRNLFKFPFMTFNYASSLSSIKRSIGNELAMKVLRAVAEEKITTSDNAMIAKLIGIKNDLQTKELSQIKFPGTNQNVLKELSAVFAATYGGATETFMSSTFAPLVEANTLTIASTKVMFRAYHTEYKKAKEAWVAENPGITITTEVIKDITESLSDKFPYIRAPWSEGRKDGVAVYKTRLTTRGDRQTDPVQTQVWKEGSKTEKQSLTVQGMEREMTEAFASGAVLPIHWLDATVIGTILSGGGILGIHDAIVLGMGGKKAFEAVANMNKATYDNAVGYNLMESVLTSLVETLNTMTAEEVKALDTKGLIERDVHTPVSEIVEQLAKFVEKTNEAREELYSNDLAVGNIAGVKGMTYTGKQMTAEDVFKADVKPDSSIISTIEKQVSKAIKEGNC